MLDVVDPDAIEKADFPTATTSTVMNNSKSRIFLLV